MSKETRTIRPFIGLGGLEGVLDEALLHVGPEACLANEGITVDLAPHEFLLRPVSIEWGSDAEAFEHFKTRLGEGAEAAGLAPGDLSLTVVANSSFLKLADIVFTCPASDLGHLARITDLTVGARPAAFCTPFSGFHVDAYLVLARSLDPKPLRPYLRGTWLAQARFRVGTTQGPALLPPTPLIRVRTGSASCVKLLL